MKSLQNSKNKHLSEIAVGILACAFACIAIAAPQEFSSGTGQTQLVELYTSEGCSSCPVADRWLSKLKTEPGLWRDVVPVAFHVDYWDYIGWKDIYADESHSMRQRQHARDGNVKTVYTPGFVINGEEWRGFFTNRARPHNPSEAGKLTIRIDGREAAVTYAPPDTVSELSATIALLGAGIVSDVRAGENANRELNHDFAVLNHQTIKLKPNGTGSLEAQISLPMAPSMPAKKAIAVWVSKRGSLIPLQATGGWLD